MTVAHTDMNIPTIPGIAPHPRQIAEQQRLAALKQAQIAAGLEPVKADSGGSGKRESLMPDKTRQALKTLVAALHKAEGVQEEMTDPVKPSAPASSSETTASPPSSAPAAAPATEDKAKGDATAKPAPPTSAPEAKPAEPPPTGKKTTLLDDERDDLSSPAAAPAPVPRPTATDR
jgi:penicillin-binding protein 1A